MNSSFKTGAVVEELSYYLLTPNEQQEVDGSRAAAAVQHDYGAICFGNGGRPTFMTPDIESAMFIIIDTDETATVYIRSNGGGGAKQPIRSRRARNRVTKSPLNI